MFSKSSQRRCEEEKKHILLGDLGANCVKVELAYLFFSFFSPNYTINLLPSILWNTSVFINLPYNIFFLLVPHHVSCAFSRFFFYFIVHRCVVCDVFPYRSGCLCEWGELLYACCSSMRMHFLPSTRSYYATFCTENDAHTSMHPPCTRLYRPAHRHTHTMHFVHSLCSLRVCVCVGESSRVYAVGRFHFIIKMQTVSQLSCRLPLSLLLQASLCFAAASIVVCESA